MRVRPTFPVIIGFLVTLIASSAVHAEPHIALGPTLGHVAHDEAKFWLKASGEARPGVIVSRHANLSDPVANHEGDSLDEAAAYMQTLTVTGLEPETTYYYAVTLDGEPQMVAPYPSFTTAPAPGERTRLRIAFTSCAGRSGTDSAAAYADLHARADADMLLLLGDNHYADSTDPEVQRRFYYAQRDTPGYRAATLETPTYGIWDDHDYGPNDSDRTAEGKADSLRTFIEHWANPGYGEPDNPGIYSRFTHGDIEFFLLDDRYYRDPNNAEADGSKTMLGERQKAWLKQGLAESEATFKIIATGSEFQMNGHTDSWTSFERERRELMDFIAEQEITGVIVLSGDRHFTGAYQIEGRLIEATAGPIGSRNFPTENLPDMFINHGTGKLYAVLELDTTADPPTTRIEVYRAAEGLINEHELTWDQVNGREPVETLPVGEPGPDER